MENEIEKCSCDEALHLRAALRKICDELAGDERNVRIYLMAIDALLLLPP